MNGVFYDSKILHGDQSGRTIGFPTINLDPLAIPQDTPPGVYAASLHLLNPTDLASTTDPATSPTAPPEKLIGALYFGPRLVKGETHNVLEIFILDFDQEVYGQRIEFSLQKFIRPVLDFTSLEELKIQLQKDIVAVRAAQSDENQLEKTAEK